MRTFLIACSIAALSSLTLAGLSSASTDIPSCFENLGQTGCPRQETFPLNHIRKLSCQNLWLVRNSIYNDRGYCFKTQAAKQEFDNSDCVYNDAQDIVDLFNQHESKNVSRIVKVENEKSC